ncbi:MAG: transposase [Treponema sp.]|nr:transposase [Treponema sp.]
MKAIRKGYKPHLDVSDVGFPLTSRVTAANVHGGQTAIPLEKLTEERALFFCSLTDAGLDATIIDSFIRGCIPIIDPNRRNDKHRPPLDPAKKERYKIRTTAERSYSHLKGHLLLKNILVKGYAKITLVLMSAVICLAVLKYLQYFIL